MTRSNQDSDPGLATSFSSKPWLGWDRPMMLMLMLMLTLTLTATACWTTTISAPAQ
jgi:hypothetical protein